MKIRDVIKLIEGDGWYLVPTKGSHRQYTHPMKSGRVTPSQRRFGPRHIEQCVQAGANSDAEEEKGEDVRMYRFLIVIEKANGNFSAYSPDLPGCVATGKTREQVTRNMHEAIEMHVRGLLEDELPVPKSRAFAEYVAVL